jgi:hypothetical protein
VYISLLPAGPAPTIHVSETLDVKCGCNYLSYYIHKQNLNRHLLVFVASKEIACNCFIASHSVPR